MNSHTAKLISTYISAGNTQKGNKLLTIYPLITWLRTGGWRLHKSNHADIYQFMYV